MGIINKQQGKLDEALAVSWTRPLARRLLLSCQAGSWALSWRTRNVNILRTFFSLWLVSSCLLRQILHDVLQAVNDPAWCGDVWSQIGHVYELKREVC